MKNKVNKLVNNTRAKAAMLSATIAAALPQIAHADVGANKDPNNIVEGILEVVVDIFPLIGGFFCVAGIFKLIMAYRNDQPEAQTAAAKDIVIGAVFIVFRVFVWNAVKNLIF